MFYRLSSGKVKEALVFCIFYLLLIKLKLNTYSGNVPDAVIGVLRLTVLSGGTTDFAKSFIHLNLGRSL